MPERQEIRRDFEAWWDEAGCRMTEQVFAQHPADQPWKNLLLIVYAQGRIDENSRITRELEARLEARRIVEGIA